MKKPNKPAKKPATPAPHASPLIVPPATAPAQKEMKKKRKRVKTRRDKYHSKYSSDWARKEAIKAQKRAWYQANRATSSLGIKSQEGSGSSPEPPLGEINSRSSPPDAAEASDISGDQFPEIKFF